MKKAESRDQTLYRRIVYDYGFLARSAGLYILLVEVQTSLRMSNHILDACICILSVRNVISWGLSA